MLVVSYISSWKRPQGKRMAPNNNRGTTYQTNVKHFSNLREYFVGVVKLAFHCYNNCFLLCVFTNNHLKYLSNRTLRKLVKRYVYEFFGPPRLAPYLLISHLKQTETDQCCLPQHGPLDIHRDQRQEVPAQPLRAHGQAQAQAHQWMHR